MNDFNTQQQCDEFISGDDSLLWVEAMEAHEASRDEADRQWDEKFREIDGEYLDNQPCPW